MKTTIAFIAISLAASSVGCGLKTPKVYKPETPAVLSDVYTVEQYQADKKAYAAAVDAGNGLGGQIIRNRLIYNQKFAADTAYENYVGGLGAGRATAGVASDVAQSSISAAGTILGAEYAKQLLSAAGLWTQAFERSIKSRYHGDVSVEVFIGYMDKNREPIAKELDTCLSQDIATCPYEKARDILGRYFWAGTFQRAKQAISAGAAITQKPQ